MNFIQARIFMIIVIIVPVCDQLNGFDGTQEMTHLTVLEGDSVPLECRYRSFDMFDPAHISLQVKWEHNNESLLYCDDGICESSNVKFSFNQSGVVLNLEAVNFQDSTGSYICEVESRNKSSKQYFTDSTKFVLVVHVPVKEVKIQPTAGCLIPGRAYNFTAEVPNINPPASINWTLGNKSLSGTETNIFDESSGLYTTCSTVQLPVTSENHNQVLSVHASNIRDRTGKSDSVTLHINEAVSYGMDWRLLLLTLVSFLLMR